MDYPKGRDVDEANRMVSVLCDDLKSKTWFGWIGWGCFIASMLAHLIV